MTSHLMLVLLTAIAYCLVGARQHMTVSVGHHYTALAGDLLVEFTTGDDSAFNNTDWYIDVIESRDTGHLSPLTTVDVPGGYSDGQVSIACGVVDAVGQLVVLLRDSTTSDVVAQSNTVDVSWPTVTLRLPDSHRALTEDLRVTLSVDDTLCQSQRSHVSYTVQLLHINNASSSSDKTVVYNKTLSTLVSRSSLIVDVPCSLVDYAGSYQAVLTSSRRPDLPITVSNVVDVAWSDHYSLSMSAVQPCRNQVVVRHRQPRCDGSVYVVRLVARQLYNHDDDDDDDLVMTRSRDDWRYVSERRVKSWRTSVTFDCSLFKRDEVTCVLLVSSTLHDNTAEHLHRRHCTHRGGGEWSTAVSSSSSSWSSSRQCQCGCTLTDNSGHIIASARQRCDAVIRRWTINVQPRHIITLTVDYAVLSRSSSLRLYDTVTAHTGLSPLLLKLPQDEDASNTVVTSGNRMLIEYVIAAADNDVSTARRSDGFIASYVASIEFTVEQQNTSVASHPSPRQYSVLTFWDSQVAVVGIGLCTGVILASLSFVCHQRLTLRRLRAKQDTETPAYRALVAGKQQQQSVSDVKHSNNEKTLQPRSPHVTGHRAAAIKLQSTPSPVRERHLTPSSARRLRQTLATTSSPRRTGTVFQTRTPPTRCSRAQKDDPDTTMMMTLETRPPVEGRDSLSVEQLLETEPQGSRAELKTASFVPATQCSVAVLRCLERVEQVTRATSPMSTSDVDVLPDISGLLTSGTDTDDVDETRTMTGGASWSSLSDLVAGCEAECDSDEFTDRRRYTFEHHHLRTARTKHRDAVFEPDVYYC